MKNILEITLIFLLVICCSKPKIHKQTANNSNDEIKIEEIQMVFSLTKNWEKSGDKMMNGPLTGYNFIRKPIVDGKGMNVSPFIGIMFEEVPENINILMYSMSKRTQLPPMKIIEVLSSDSKEYKLKYGVGYLSTYVDSNGLTHKIIVLHMINSTKGIQMIIDGTESVYDQMKNEYIDIVKSIKFN
jgi:ribosomal protein L35AE/L33A